MPTIQSLLSKMQSAGDIELSDSGEIVSDGQIAISVEEAKLLADAMARDGITASDKTIINKLLENPHGFADAQAMAIFTELAEQPTAAGYDATLDKAQQEIEILVPRKGGLSAMQTSLGSELLQVLAADAWNRAQGLLSAPDATPAEKAEAHRLIAVIAGAASYADIEIGEMSPSQLAAKSANALKAYIEHIAGDGLSAEELETVAQMVKNDHCVDPAEHVVVKQLLQRAGRAEDAEMLSKTPSYKALQGIIERGTVKPELIKRFGELNAAINTQLRHNSGLTPQQRAEAFMSAFNELEQLARTAPLDLGIEAIDAVDTGLMRIFEADDRNAILEALKLDETDGLAWRVQLLTILIEKAPADHCQMRSWRSMRVKLGDALGREQNKRAELAQLERTLAEDTDPKMRDFSDLLNMWTKHGGGPEINKAHDRIAQEMIRRLELPRFDATSTVGQIHIGAADILRGVKTLKFEYQGTKGDEPAREALKQYNKAIEVYNSKVTNPQRHKARLTLDEVTADLDIYRRS